jgi:hypothetical protein
MILLENTSKKSLISAIEKGARGGDFCSAGFNEYTLRYYQDKLGKTLDPKERKAPVKFCNRVVQKILDSELESILSRGLSDPEVEELTGVKRDVIRKFRLRKNIKAVAGNAAISEKNKQILSQYNREDLIRDYIKLDYTQIKEKYCVGKKAWLRYLREELGILSMRQAKEEVL